MNKEFADRDTQILGPPKAVPKAIITIVITTPELGFLLPREDQDESRRILVETIPSYAKDLKLNFSTVVRQQTDLTEQQMWGTVAACAMASRNEDLTAAALEEAANYLTPEALQAAKGASAIMGMNNIFYRFLHLSSNEKYATMRAGLRMNVIRTHSIDQMDFELWCIAVSAINGCGACVDSHEKVLKEKGFTEEKIMAAIRVASVLHAIAVVLDTVQVTADQPVTA